MSEAEWEPRSQKAVMIDYAETIVRGGERLKRLLDSFSTTTFEIMRLLIDNGIDIEMRSVDGTTVMHGALLGGDIEAVHVMLDAGQYCGRLQS